MPITIASNIASLGAQRQLTKATESLSSSYERLSSGLRINKASDDAAGLSIALSLNTNARVYSQTIRNISDAVSASSIAQGATSQLTEIVTRLQELAEQSATGTLANKQRTALNTEAQALRAEFNRIIETTSFNGIRLLDENVGAVRIQSGDTSNFNALYLNSSNLGTSMKGTGNFSSANYGGSIGTAYATSSGDVNGDGILDVAYGGFSGITQILIGNGDGTFKSGVSVNQGTLNQSVALGDVDGNGTEDLIMTDNTSGISVYFGNGDGSFKSRVGLSGALGGYSLVLEDLDGNGAKDIVFADLNTSSVQILMSNGDGSFKAALSYTSANAYGVTIGDFDGDGYKDLAALDVLGTVTTRKGNGNGTFQSVVTLGGSGSGGRAIGVGDVNKDGKVDIVSSNHTGGTLTVHIGQGNGSFATGVSYTSGAGVGAISVSDFDGDGYSDVVATDTSGSINLYKGLSTGALGASTSIASGLNAPFLQINGADLNGDGTKDVVIGNTGVGATVLLNRGTKTSRLGEIDLSSRTGALISMRYLNTALSNLLQGVGQIGADESRFRAALNVFAVTRENYTAAASRIMDVDVAEETATLARTKILQQATASVLSQANLQPQLALQLLRG